MHHQLTGVFFRKDQSLDVILGRHLACKNIFRNFIITRRSAAAKGYKKCGYDRNSALILNYLSSVWRVF
jgi:hypothetical protein